MASKPKNAPHPNRFAYYLHKRGLTRREIAADGTFKKHFHAWMREVRQRLAVRALQRLAESLKR